MGLQLTDHARARMQQRGIGAEALDALLAFGREQHVDRGVDIVFFDKKARKRLVRADKDLARQADRLFKTYAVLGGNGPWSRWDIGTGGFTDPEPDQGRLLSLHKIGGFGFARSGFSGKVQGGFRWGFLCLS